MNPAFDALHVLLYPHGDDGWFEGIALHNQNPSRSRAISSLIQGDNSHDSSHKSKSVKRPIVSEKDYAAHRANGAQTQAECEHDGVLNATRSSAVQHYDGLLKSRKLIQQQIAEWGARIEDHRLDWFASNQAECRIENYSVIMDALNEEECDPEHIGKQVILPSSHIGSPRDLQQRYQDAMATVRVLGKPHLFITFTCNPNWPELKAIMDELQIKSAVDCPSFVSRIFKQKLE